MPLIGNVILRRRFTNQFADSESDFTGTDRINIGDIGERERSFLL